MQRRDFLKLILLNAISLGAVSEALAKIIKIPGAPPAQYFDDHLKDYLHKMRAFDQHHPEDIYLDKEQRSLFRTILKRFDRLQQIVGHGNFHLLNFDDALAISGNYSRVGRFSKAELELLEMIFYNEASGYGFWGEKPLKRLSDKIPKSKAVKIPRTGNYLFEGPAFETYQKIKNKLGDPVILTSGIRSIIKQLHLFLKKTYASEYNLSMASRSLAPPGYSYHGIGDFDVGQIGFGVDNFTERFTATAVCRKLEDLGYISLRYRKGNLLGVRFEPWHIKVSF
ncbi:D-alanyl-D-alanine carboxypeptidase family protein [Thermodesulfobacteriota bacterium]